MDILWLQCSAYLLMGELHGFPVLEAEAWTDVALWEQYMQGLLTLPELHRIYWGLQLY